jgi:hypothetical protein
MTEHEQCECGQVHDQLKSAAMGLAEIHFERHG